MSINADMLNSLVSITQFNKGQAAKIFDRLKTERQLVVLKNNTPSAVILSPEEYTRLAEAVEDLRLLRLAESRLAEGWGSRAIPHGTFIKEIGLTEEEIANAEDVEIE